MRWLISHSPPVWVLTGRLVFSVLTNIHTGENPDTSAWNIRRTKITVETSDIPPSYNLITSSLVNKENVAVWLYLSHVMRKPVLAICEQQRCRSACAFAQSDRHLCCSLLRYYDTSCLYIQNFKPLPSCWSWAGRFESYLVANPKDRFSRDEVHLYITKVWLLLCGLWRKKLSFIIVGYIWLYYISFEIKRHELPHDKTSKDSEIAWAFTLATH